MTLENSSCESGIKGRNKYFISDSIIVALFSFLLFCFKLGNKPFATPDEGRYVEIPREIIATGDWLTPRLNGVKYFEKPPLLYWLNAISFKSFGLNEFAMRLWIVFFATIGCVAVYAFARKIYDRKTGLIASFVLATSILYFGLARMIILDMPAGIWLTLALFCFYCGIKSPAPQRNMKRRLWFYGFSAACALGVMTKGIMALALPGPFILLWLSISSEQTSVSEGKQSSMWGRLRPFYPFSCLLIFLIIAAPWHIMVCLKNPEFFHKYFIVEHVVRYITTEVHQRYQPFWFFFAIIAGGLLPWTVFLLAALKNWVKSISGVKGLLRMEERESFLWLWSIWVLLFFSISKSKLIPYIIPIFPMLAILIAKTIVDILGAARNNRLSPYSPFLYLHAALLTVAGSVGLLIPTFAPSVFDNYTGLCPYVYVLSATFLGISLLVMLCLRFKAIKAIIGLTFALGVTTTILFSLAMPYGQKPSLKNISSVILSNKKPDDIIVSFFAYNQDLPLYCQQLVTVVKDMNELEFGTTVEDTSRWMIPDEREFLRRWQLPNAPKMWVVATKSVLLDFAQNNPEFKYHIVMQEDAGINNIQEGRRFVLFTNKM